MFDFLTGYILGERTASRAAAFSRDSAAAAGAATAGELADLEARLDRLVLVIEALWSLLVESGYTDEQLADRIRILDAADGSPDGRLTPTPSPCRSCGAMVEAGRTTCAFCGTAVSYPPDSPVSFV